MCWTCCVKPGTNSTFRDALGENELTCDDCHREEYPEQYEEPVTQATMLKRTHEIQCGKCAISDYAENIGVWNDDGTLQELGLCGECEEKYPICEICADECVDYDDKLCHGCYHKSVGADECWCACAVDECLTDRARDTLKRFAEKKDIVGCCEKCDMEIVRDSDEHDNCLIIDGGDSADKFCCQSCDEEEYICDCSVCGERLYACGSVELAEDADGGGCCAGCAPEEEDA